MNIRREGLSMLILTLMLAVFGVLMVFPLAWMMSASLKYESEVFKMPIEWIPSKINVSNYITAMTEFPFLNWYMNTALVTLYIVCLVLSVSTIAGYAFAKLEFKGKDVIFMIFIATMMIPVEVRIIPQFMIFKSLGLINNVISVALPWMFNAFSIFLMRQFFTSIPNDLLQAARIDGCNEYSTFFRIVLPLAKSQITALFILAFTWGWNEYLSPLIYISDVNNQVLSVGIASFKGEYSTNFAVQMAGATMALVPIIIVYLFAQRHFVEGIALSGVKG
ncbi:ABC transporter, permease protein [Paenibacillus sp. oral taxon 786 str. D14]|uniref:carbohydrate ABC transporter permease n=1 Tax=unclassified Paenibacillus TaxID=185978 RepID=UPI0001AFD5D2|nr:MULTISPECIES: carbohydrate ABC transporter permease [unclassified Paenibacillus]EES71677.1 ABC transporter, permease protein [Paenibacillus sp. oral taxon 786 str. D14]OXL87541.1 ABC transporter permease [Paenibacillus sp. SSG-1]